MQKRISVLIVTLIVANFVYAQENYLTEKFQAVKLKTTDGRNTVDYMPVVINNPNNLNNPIMSFSHKSAMHKLKTGSNFRHSKSVEKPYIIGGFEAVYDAGAIPNDDAIAVSNEGKVISMRNSKITFYDENLSMIRSQSLSSFTFSLGISGFKYDPRVVYDQNEDRFIIAMLNGFDHTSNHIIIAFSETNDPDGNWHFYSVPGNILDDNTWSDYPTIAINENELFISFTNFADMDSWDTWDFYGARIIQMNKFQGYQGADEVDYAYHIVNPGYPVEIPSEIYYYNVTPVKGGKTLYGPNMYFMSSLDCPFPDQETGEYPPNDTIFLVEFTSTLDDPDFEINSTLLNSDKPYGMSVKTPQPNGMYLQTNYNTIKDSYYENGIIHFTLNSIDYDNNRAGIFHGIIQDVGNQNNLTSNIISSDTMGIAYASIVYIGEDENDDSALIGFNYASESLFPGNACIRYDNGEYSGFLVLKEGEGIMNMTTSQSERWGDFTTMQVKYDEPDKVFFTGSFGRLNRTRTWVSILSLKEPEQSNVIQNNYDFTTKVFPNPATEFFNIEFELSYPQICSFKLYDNNGRLVDEIYKHRVRKGNNRFTFNASHLKSGVYYLKIQGSQGFNSTEKVIVK